MNDKIKELKEEIKQLTEVCEIMSNPQTMKEIAISMRQISNGQTKPLSELIV